LLRDLGYTHLDLNVPITTTLSEPDEETLDDVAKIALACTKCKLAGTRTNVVYGVGNPHADLMFVGEAPGHDEDKKGEPFVGRAGQLLTDIIKAMKLTRDDVYISFFIDSAPTE